MTRSPGTLPWYCGPLCRAPSAAAVLLWLAASMPCAAAAGTTLVNIPHDGMARSFYLHVPPRGNPGSRYAVVFAFHGALGNGAKLERQTGLDGPADRDGFLVVYANAVSGHWNDGRDTTANGNDDVGYVTTVLDFLAAHHNIDIARVYAMGASNGGMFVYRLACDTRGRFVAFAAVIANLPAAYLSHCRSPQPAPVLIMNGTDDPLMHWAGGAIGDSRALHRAAGGRVLSAPATADFWRRVDGCADTPVNTTLPDRSDDGTRVVLHLYADCSTDLQLLFYEIRGGGHAWPGYQGQWRWRAGGTVSQDIDATAAIVDFFREYGLDHARNAIHSGNSERTRGTAH